MVAPLHSTSLLDRTISGEPNVTASSYFGEEVRIDSQNWAITLISVGEKWFGHAMIVIEGVENGCGFMQTAHFGLDPESNATAVLTGKIGIEFTNDQWLAKRVVKKTETWLATKEKVQCMVQAMWHEKELSKQGQDSLLFTLGGNRSIFTPYNSLQEFSDFNEAFKALSSKRKEGNGQWDMHEKKDKWVVAKRPDNCISWASRHLEKAGIVLPTNVSDFLIKLPILFTNQPENEGYCNNISINNIYILGCTIL